MLLRDSKFDYPKFNLFKHALRSIYHQKCRTTPQPGIAIPRFQSRDPERNFYHKINEYLYYIITSVLESLSLSCGLVLVLLFVFRNIFLIRNLVFANPYWLAVLLFSAFRSLKLRNRFLTGNLLPGLHP